MSLLKSGGLYLIGEVLSKLIPFVLLPYFSNTLSVDEFGRLGLYQAYYNFFVIFILFGFDSIILRSYHRYGEKISNELLTLSFFYTSCVFILLLMVSLFFDSILTLSIATSYFLSLISLVFIFFQREGKAKNYIKYQVLNVLISTIFTILLFNYFIPSLESRAIAICTASFSLVIVCFFKYRMVFFSKIGFYRLKLYSRYVSSFGFGITLNKLSFFFRGQFDRVVINYRFELSELAVYSLSSQLSLAFSIVLIAFNRVLAPHFYSKIRSKDISKRKIEKLMFLSVLFPISVFVTLNFVPSGMYSYVFGDSYSQVSYYLPPLALSQSIQVVYMIMSTTIIYVGEIKKLSLVTIVSAVIHVVMLYLFPYENLYLFSWISFFSGTVQIVLVYFLVFKRIRI